MIGAKIHVGVQKRLSESRVKNLADYLAELFKSKTGTFWAQSARDTLLKHAGICKLSETILRKSINTWKNLEYICMPVCFPNRHPICSSFFSGLSDSIPVGQRTLESSIAKIYLTISWESFPYDGGKVKKKLELSSKFMKSFPNLSLFFTWKILSQFLLQLSLQTFDPFNDENIFAKFWKTKMNNLIK